MFYLPKSEMQRNKFVDEPNLKFTIIYRHKEIYVTHTSLQNENKFIRRYRVCIDSKLSIC